jgi:NADH-ubiquinone reductase complex 1 MLRQ subunit
MESSSAASGASSFRKDWLSDPATYPIIGILCFAMTGAFGFIGYKFATHPNVRVTSKAKGHVLRTW